MTTPLPDRRERKHVLLVDDESTTQRLVERALRSQAPNAQIQFASNGVEALQVLARDPIDLLITALGMPVIDGVELLHHVAKRGLAMPVIVIGGHAVQAGELPPPTGAIEYVADPLDIDELVHLAHTLLHAVDRPPETTIGLLDLVQLVARARRTCTLRVSQNQIHGALQFTGGALVDAHLGDLHGAPAALEILAWSGTSVRYDPFLRARATTIQTSVARLLQDMRRSTTPEPVRRVAPPAIDVASPAANDRPVLSLEPAPARRPPATPMPPPRPTPAPTATTSTRMEPWEGPGAEPKIARILADAMAIEGALGATLAVWELDLSLGAVGPQGPALERSGNSRVMRALLTTMTRLDMQTGVHDVLISFDTELHILAPLAHHAELSLSVAIDAARSNLALARHRVQKLVRDLVL